MHKCNTCSQIKDVSAFSKKHGRPSGLQYSCKDCYAKISLAHRSTEKGYFIKLLDAAQKHAQKRLRKGRDVAGVCNLTYEDVAGLWAKQKGLCYYSNVPMVLKPNVSWRASLERLDPAVGYILSNVVLCCLEFNDTCQWSREKVARMFDSQPEIDARSNLIQEKPRVGPSLTVSTNKLVCSCGQPKAARNWQCRACKAAYDKARTQTPVGHLMSLLKSARAHTVSRNKNNREHTIDIDLDFLKQQYIRQGGRCYYSGINMTIGERDGKDWVMSLERLDNDIGYIQSNTVLICWELNTCHVNWSKGKVDIVKKAIM